MDVIYQGYFSRSPHDGQRVRVENIPSLLTSYQISLESILWSLIFIEKQINVKIYIRYDKLILSVLHLNTFIKIFYNILYEITFKNMFINIYILRILPGNY